MDRHVGSVTDTADSSWEDLSAVEVLDCAESDGPAYGVDEDGSDSCVRGGLILSGNEDRHVNRHVDVGDALEANAGEHAASSSKDVDETPCEDHGENELHDAVGSRCDQGGVSACDACVLEDLSNVSKYT